MCLPPAPRWPWPASPLQCSSLPASSSISLKDRSRYCVPSISHLDFLLRVCPLRHCSDMACHKQDCQPHCVYKTAAQRAQGIALVTQPGNRRTTAGLSLAHPSPGPLGDRASRARGFPHPVCARFVQMTVPVKLRDPAPSTQSPPCCSGCNLGPRTPIPPLPGAPTLARPGGHLLPLAQPQALRRNLFLSGRSRSWNPPRASPSPHAARGAWRGDPSWPSPHPPTRETFPESFHPCTQSPARLTDQLLLALFPPLLSYPFSLSHMPF